MEKCQSQKTSSVMKEFKEGNLHQGNGNIVYNPKQAIAIALSVARKYCKEDSPIKKKRASPKPNKKRKHGDV
jgi:hypothetical protein